MESESLNTVLIKRKSWSEILDLITPYIAPKNLKMVNPAHELWDSIPLDRQRQIWVTLWEKKMRGVKIKDHPYYAIKDCVPMPFDWNGSEHADSMIANFKMVGAKYYDQYGLFTLKAAQAFHMTDIVPLNYKPIRQS